MSQHIEIITDASLVALHSDLNLKNLNILETSKNLHLAIGSGICRLKGSNAENPNARTRQLFRGVFVFSSQQSYDAELLTGIKCLHTISKNFDLRDHILTWYCDLEYLDKLFRDAESIQNHLLKSLVLEIKSLIKDCEIIIKYPSTSSIMKYHDYCHRICTEVRQTILNDPEYLDVSLKKVFQKNKNWALIDSIPLGK